MTPAIPGLHDIHLPASPGWWPPAPGWWVLAGLLAIALAWLVRTALRARRERMLERGRRRRVADALREYDSAIDSADSVPSRLAAASGLLRRAAKARDPAAAALEGDAWLRFLDGGDPSRAFSQGPGSLLRDGAFRRTLDADIAATLALARARFTVLLGPDSTEQDSTERSRA